MTVRHLSSVIDESADRTVSATYSLATCLGPLFGAALYGRQLSLLAGPGHASPAAAPCEVLALASLCVIPALLYFVRRDDPRKSGGAGARAAAAAAAPPAAGAAASGAVTARGARPAAPQRRSPLPTEEPAGPTPALSPCGHAGTTSRFALVVAAPDFG